VASAGTKGKGGFSWDKMQEDGKGGFSWDTDPEWRGAKPSKWGDRHSANYISRNIVETDCRNGPETSFTRKGFSFSHQALPLGESRRMNFSSIPTSHEGVWKQHRRAVVPPHITNKEQLEGVKWTKKPPFVGKTGLGADRKPDPPRKQRVEEPTRKSKQEAKLDVREQLLVREMHTAWEAKHLHGKR